MIKKIKIAGLVSIILVSMVGIPSVKHFCDMMGISLSGDCEMICTSCNHFQQEPESCCSSESETNYGVSITSSGDNCCSDEFVLNKVDDEFIVNKTESNNKITSIDNSTDLFLVQKKTELSAKKFFIKETSPSTKLKSEIYISVRSLLI